MQILCAQNVEWSPDVYVVKTYIVGLQGNAEMFHP